LLGGNNGAGYGNNDIGQVAGSVQTKTIDPTCLVGGQPVAPVYQSQQAVPVIWTNGRVHQLAVPAGDTGGSANAINNLGQATGATGDCLTTPQLHAVLWKNGKVTELGNLGGVYNNPFAINDVGQITGTSDLPGDLTSHAFLWQNGVMKDIGTLPGDYYSVGYGINNLGQIVGQSCDANYNCRAFLWQNGKMTDLNALIPKNSPVYVYLAAAIDDVGVIVGYAWDQTTNTSPGFVAIPNPWSAKQLTAHAAEAEVAKRPLPESLRLQIQQNTKKRAVRRQGPQQ
jgi:probable HAF family extracellular repeat protein